MSTKLAPPISREAEKIEKELDAFVLDIEGMLKLFGGTKHEKELFFEKLKGITTPAEWKLIEAAVLTARQTVKTAGTQLGTVKSQVDVIAG